MEYIVTNRLGYPLLLYNIRIDWSLCLTHLVLGDVIQQLTRKLFFFCASGCKKLWQQLLTSLPWGRNLVGSGRVNSYIAIMPPTTAPANGIPLEVDMGYEEHQPARRRNSMTEDQERERRASIKAILADGSMDPVEKGRSIQHLMDGRRTSISGGSMASSMMNGRRQSISVGSTASTGGGASSVCTDDGNISVVSYGYKNFHVSNTETRRAEEQRPPCSHYERNCTIIAPCCGAAFGCRICHDECPALPPSM